MPRDAVERFCATLPFSPDPFQIEAMNALVEGRSVLVAAPTGTGKTAVAEFAVELALSKGLRAFYTTPIKALSNQKFRDFRERYGDRVGLLTGDLVENREGRLLVMTTEVARNMLVQDHGSFADVGCLIFDEVHYLADPERGTSWEEAILLAPSHVPLVCLSATVPNAGEIAEWLRTTGRNVALIQTEERTVPLLHRYYMDGKLYPILEGKGSIPNSLLKAAAEKRTAAPANGTRRSNPATDSRAQRDLLPAEVLRALEAEDLLPAIYFMFSRRAAEESAESCRRLLLLDRQEAAANRAITKGRLGLLSEEDRALAQVQRLLALLPRGIGFHHAGLLPPLKSLVEELLAAGKLKVVFATDTLALGINVPARSVVLGEMTKFDGHSRRALSPGEYRQMTGRAGRRGMDPVGYSILLHSPWVGLDRMQEIATGDVERLESAFRPGYSTILNLWPGPGEEQRLADMVAGSLRQFHDTGKIRSLAREKERYESALAVLPEGCPRDGGPVNWLAQDRQLRRDHERAESAVDAAKKAAKRARSSGNPQSIASAEERLSLAQERERSTGSTLAKSPCRDCPLRPEHRRMERERRSYAGLIVATSRELDGARKDSHRKAERTIRSVRGVLENFGYLSAGKTTAKANCLMRLFDGNGLVISELLDWGVVGDASPQEVAEVASWFAFDKEGSARALAGTERLNRIRTAAEATAKKVMDVEQRHGLKLSSPLSTEFRGVALAWVNGSSLGDICSRSGLSEGDVVFGLQKTIDLCRQIAQAALYSRTPSLVRKAADAERLLRHGVVDSYYRWVVGTPEESKGAALSSGPAL